MKLLIGTRRFDVTHRALVMGILNRTADSFHDGGRYLRLDDLLRRAERLVVDGADLLDVGAQAGGVDTRLLPVEEEADLAAEAVAELRRRFDVPISVDTWRAPVARAAFAAGAEAGNDMSGFSDPAYLPAAAAAGASVVATHIRRPPRTPDPDPVYADLVGEVSAALSRLARLAELSGIPSGRILVDPGLDLGKSWRQSLRLLAATPALADLGYPLLVAPSNKIFLGRLLNLPGSERHEATVAACAWAASRGARVLRVHDARGARQAADLVAALEGGPPA